MVMSTHAGILIHAVFSTKLRFKLLSEVWRDELYAYMGGTIREHRGDLLSAGGVEDHVHLFMRIHPSYAISDTMKLIKANSSRWINENRKISAKFEWQRGYGAFSVSQSMASKVDRYICDQKRHHATKSFVDEYLELLRVHEIEFDPRYVFDQEIVG